MPIFRLNSCDDSRSDQYTDTDLTANDGKTIMFQSHCWDVSLVTVALTPVIPVVIQQEHDDCTSCLCALIVLPDPSALLTKKDLDNNIILAQCCYADKADLWVEAHTFGREEKTRQLALEMKYLKTTIKLLQGHVANDNLGIDTTDLNCLTESEVLEVISKIKTLCADCGC